MNVHDFRQQAESDSRLHLTEKSSESGVYMALQLLAQYADAKLVSSKVFPKVLANPIRSHIHISVSDFLTKMLYELRFTWATFYLLSFKKSAASQPYFKVDIFAEDGRHLGGGHDMTLAKVIETIVGLMLDQENTRRE